MRSAIWRWRSFFARRVMFSSRLARHRASGRLPRRLACGHDADMNAPAVILLPESGDALVVWPDGRAIRIRPDGSTVPGQGHMVSPDGSTMRRSKWEEHHENHRRPDAVPRRS